MSEGLFRILDEDGLIGFANMNGKVIVSQRFTQVNSFRDGRAIFCQGCKVGSYLKFHDENARGELLQIIGRLQDTVIIQRKVRYGMINTKGDTVLQPIYDRIDDFKDSIALVYKDGRAFYIDRQGNEVAYDPKKHPNQKPLDPHISKRIKYIDSWESLLKD
ncbi:WG repeat protein [Sphingobacterium allocomposti]|uniref:WG repeat protein n=2 Tax=Sphingobacterium allocomposti TaxID=415956 RepID=A0A5S5DA52_9SPHI|nr:WG repeat protein [Sphingobacterium composti Yoo et al. 2007 non Ten et al. 2007]